MTPAEMDQVFGAERLQVASSAHVEVFREAVQHGVERRYTKRFVGGTGGDLRRWTEREWRVLEGLARHGAPVAKPLDFLPADASGPARLQTRDAGATLEQWATLVPLRRGERALVSVFGDCAHWWSLARQCLIALDAVHALGFVHLELKPDNVCIPWAPAGAGRPTPGQPLGPRFRGLALIDVAFSLLPEVALDEPLPLLRQQAYEYQSPRLLHALEEGRRGHLAPTRALDWRCDFFSLAGMLWRYLPEFEETRGSDWTRERHALASDFVRQLLDVHGAAVPAQWPHRELIAQTTLRLRDPGLAAALEAGCSFDPGRVHPLAAAATPPTRLTEVMLPAPPAAPTRSAHAPSTQAEGEGSAAAAPIAAAAEASDTAAAESGAGARKAALAGPTAVRRRRVLRAGFGAGLIGAAAAAWWLSGDFAARFQMPSLADLGERGLPAPSPAARTPSGSAVGASAAGHADAGFAANDPLAAQAAAWLNERLPAIADVAEQQLAPVLALAAKSAEFRRRGDVRAATGTLRSAAPPPAPPSAASAEQARSLNDDALVAYGRSSDVAEAIGLQTRALGANPFDSEIVGNLAFLHLRQRPPEAETARRLALYALTLNDARFPSGRIDDWSTLAVASALTGHDVDARNAWFVALALTSDVQRLCTAAVSAQANQGERLRPSVQALLQRALSSAAYGRCEVASAGASATTPGRAKAQARPAPVPRRPIP
jgi:hypothetical protein